MTFHRHEEKKKRKYMERCLYVKHDTFAHLVIGPNGAWYRRWMWEFPKESCRVTGKGGWTMVRRAPLESVSLCTRFSGFSTISSFNFDCLSCKLVSMFFWIFPMFVAKDFVRDWFVAQIRAKICMRAGIRAYLREETALSKNLGYEHWNYPKEHAYQFSAQTVKTETR